MVSFFYLFAQSFHHVRRSLLQKLLIAKSGLRTRQLLLDLLQFFR